MTFDDDLRTMLRDRAVHGQAAPTLADDAEQQGKSIAVRRRAVGVSLAVLVAGGVAFAGLPQLGDKPADVTTTPTPSAFAPIHENALQLGTGLRNLPAGPAPRAMSLVIDGRVVDVADGRATTGFELPGKHVEQVQRIAGGFVALAAKIRESYDGTPAIANDDYRIVLVRDGKTVTLTRGYDGTDLSRRSVEAITSFAVSPDGNRLAYSRDTTATQHTEIRPDGSQVTTQLEPGAPELADLVEIELPSGRVLHRRHSGYDSEVLVVGYAGDEVYVSPATTGTGRVLRWTPDGDATVELPLEYLMHVDAANGLGTGTPSTPRPGRTDSQCIQIVRLPAATRLDDYECVREFTVAPDGTALLADTVDGRVQVRRAPDWQSHVRIEATYPSLLHDAVWETATTFLALGRDSGDQRRWTVLRCTTDGTGCDRVYDVPGTPEEVDFAD